MTVLGCAARRETGVDLSTNVGAAGSESVRDIAIDEEGSVYLTGGTDSLDFPTTVGVYSREHSGQIDVFVMQLGSDGRLI
jgi:Beta-propeller repeat